MEMNTVFLCTTIGALVGTIVGILLMNRKVRMPISDADLADLRGKLESAESSLSAANVTVEDLRKQVAERDQTLKQQTEDLKKRQEQLDKAGAEAEKDKLRRSVNEQLSQEMSAQNAALLKERADLELKVEEAGRLGAEQASRIAFLEPRLEEQTREVNELTGRVEGLIAEGAALSRFREQESRHRAALETQLSAEQERAQQLSKQVENLESERSGIVRKLHEERESASRGMELLLMAQENFSRVLQPVNGELRTGEIRHLAAEPEPVEVHNGTHNGVQSAASGD